MRAQPKASHFIDGDYVEDTAGTMFESIFPATGEVIARLYAATPAIVELAVASAQKAIKGEFLKRLKARTQAILTGDPLNERTQLGPDPHPPCGRSTGGGQCMDQ